MRPRQKTFFQLLSAPPTLRFRLMALIGMVFLLNLMATMTTVAIFTYRSEAAAWRGRQTEAAQSAATTVANFINKAQNILEVGFIIGKDPIDHQNVADKIVKLSPTFLEVIRLDSKGDIQGTASKSQPVLANLFTISQSQWFQEARAGRPYYGTVQVSVNDEPYLILAVPLSDGGIAAGRLSMNVLQDVVSNIHFGESGKAYVFNSDGQIIAHTNRQLALDYVNIANKPEYKAVMSSSGYQWNGTFVNLAGNTVVGASEEIPGTGWHIMTELDQREAFRTSRNMGWIIVGLLLFMSLVMFYVNSNFNKSVFLPINNLKEGALAIGAGNLKYRIGMKRTDEIGILSSAFDEMAVQLGEQRLILEQRTVELEAIHNIGLSLTSQLDLKQVLDTVLASIFKLLPNITYAYIFLDHKNDLVFGASLFSNGSKDIVIQNPQFENLSNLIIQTGQIQIASDIIQFPGDFYQSEIKSLIGIPLMIGEKVVGIMNVVYSDTHDFPPTEIRLLNLFASQVAIAIKNARLYGEAQQELLQRTRVESALRDSERRYRLIAENSSDVIGVRDLDFKLIYISPSISRLRGYTPEEAMRQTLSQTYTPESVATSEQIRAKELSMALGMTPDEIRLHSFSMEVETYRKDGSTVWVEIAMTYIPDNHGKPAEILEITRDITERKQAQTILEKMNVELEKRVLERTAELSQLNILLVNENKEKSKLYTQVQESLKEKEILLKEIHHRVKNNLQIISSLLNLQSAQIKDPLTIQLFRDSQNRVRSMALIHEKLYQSQDLARIDFHGYAESLSSYLMRSFAAEGRGVGFNVEVSNIALDIDQAIPCGLIINELVSNSLKYAFPNGRIGEVHIQFNLDANQRYVLKVGDNGVGFPETIDFRNTTSLGLQLVNSLVDQIDGTIELIKSGGTEFCITFVEPEHLNR